MAASNLNLGKASGGVLNIQPADGTTNTSLVLPASGTVVATDVAVTDNAIARYDGTTGKVQNSGVIIDDSGNLNLGSVANYGGKLSINVAQTSGYAKYLTFRDSSSGTLLDFSTYGDPSYGTSNIINFTGPYLAIRQSDAERMRIDFNGNVGIGATPTTKIHIKSSALNSTVMKVENQANTNGIFSIANYSNGNGGISVNDGAGNPLLLTDSAGKLIFGSNVFGGRISITGDYSAYGDTHITMRNNPSTNYGNIVFQNAAGTQVGYIQASNTGTAYVVSSDYRLKEDIKPMLGSIERLMELKPCNFKWKETGTRVDGFIAHELQEVVPEAALGVKDEMMEEEYELSPRVEATYDEEGNELTPVIEAIIGKREVPKYQGIDQSKLVPLLTSALQDAILKIESLESRIKILEGAK